MEIDFAVLLKSDYLRNLINPWAARPRPWTGSSADRTAVIESIGAADRRYPNRRKIASQIKVVAADGRGGGRLSADARVERCRRFRERRYGHDGPFAALARSFAFAWCGGSEHRWLTSLVFLATTRYQIDPIFPHTARTPHFRHLGGKLAFCARPGDTSVGKCQHAGNFWYRNGLSRRLDCRRAMA